MKTAEEILIDRFPNAKELDWFNPIQVCMEEYATQFKPQWISVEERLPDNIDNVLAYNNNMYNQDCCVEVAFFDEDKQWKGAPIYFTDGITHWMPLPEKPKM